MDEYKALEKMLKEYEDSFGDVDARMSDSFNCSFCSATCFSTNCRGGCMSAIAPRLGR